MLDAGLMAALTGAGQGFLQGEQKAHDRRRQEEQDVITRRNNKLTMYKQIAEANPALASAAMQVDPDMQEFAGPMLAAQKAGHQRKVDAIMADPQYDPEAAVKAVKVPRLTAPASLQAYGPALGKDYENFINTAPGFRQQRLDAFKQAQDTARQDVIKKRDEAIAGLGDPNQLRFFKPHDPKEYAGGKYVVPVDDNGAPIIDQAKWLSDQDSMAKAGLTAKVDLEKANLSSQTTLQANQQDNAQSDLNNRRTVQASMYGTDVGAQTSRANTKDQIEARAELQANRLAQARELFMVADQRTRDLAAMKRSAGSDATKMANFKRQLINDRATLEKRAADIQNNILNDPDAPHIQTELLKINERIKELDALEKDVPAILLPAADPVATGGLTGAPAAVAKPTEQPQAKPAQAKAQTQPAKAKPTAVQSKQQGGLSGGDPMDKVLEKATAAYVKAKGEKK